MSDRRARATGRMGARRGDRYAQIPGQVQRSLAYRSVPDSAKVVLVALAAQFSGSNNGDLSLPFSEAKDLGVSTKAKLYSGLALLELVGLIRKTRQGGKQPLGCTLYALTWRELPPSDKYDLGIKASRVPTNEWAHWTPPANWREIIRQVVNKQRGRGSRQIATAAAQSRFGEPTLPRGKTCTDQRGGKIPVPRGVTAETK